MSIDIPTTCITIPGNSKSRGGYQKIWDGVRMIYLHRHICEQVAGRPMLDTEVARHICHNDRCINPHHLIPGTQSDDVADMHAAGRARYGVSIGEKHGRAKITEDMARRIFAQLNIGCSCPEIAEYLKVPIDVVRNIKSGRTWKHLPRPF